MGIVRCSRGLDARGKVPGGAPWRAARFLTRRFDIKSNNAEYKMPDSDSRSGIQGVAQFRDAAPGASCESNTRRCLKHSPPQSRAKRGSRADARPSPTCHNRDGESSLRAQRVWGVY